MTISPEIRQQIPKVRGDNPHLTAQMTDEEIAVLLQQAAILYYNLGLFNHQLGQSDQARLHLQKAKTLFEMVGDIPMIQMVAQSLGKL